MREPKLRGVNIVRKRLADGTVAVHYYHRATKTRLPTDPEERRLAVLRLNDAPAEVIEASTGPARGTLAWLIERYKESEEWAEARESTRADYRWHFGKLAEEFGDIPVALIGREGIKEYRKALIEEGKPFNTFHRLKKLRTLLRFARLELRLIDRDPFEEVEIPAPPRRDVMWSRSDEPRFLEVAEPLIRRAYMLAAYTAQRPGDCWAMTDTCIGQSVERGGRRVLWLMLRQEKTGKPVWVPMHPKLCEELALGPLHPGSELLAPAPRGGRWDKNNFARRFRMAREAAGLPAELQFRDLRRTAMVRLAEAGATIPQIAAVSGHSIEQTQKILEHYVPRTRLMALAAMDLLLDDEAQLRRGFVLLSGGADSGLQTALQTDLQTAQGEVA